MSKGYMYILECSDGSYYTGSTKDLELRLAQHQAGEGANHTKKRLPVKLVYYEEFKRIDEAFYREKQVQGWSRKKKEALINNMPEKLHKLASCMNDSHYKNVPFDSAQGTDAAAVEQNRFDSAQGTDAAAVERSRNQAEVTPKNKNIYNFTVGELIKELKQYPKDMPVVVSGYENGYENFYHPLVKKVKHLPENPYWDGQFQIADNGKEVLLLEREVRHD